MRAQLRGDVARSARDVQSEEFQESRNPAIPGFRTYLVGCMGWYPADISPLLKAYTVTRLSPQINFLPRSNGQAGGAVGSPRRKTLFESALKVEGARTRTRTREATRRHACTAGRGPGPRGPAAAQIKPNLIFVSPGSGASTGIGESELRRDKASHVRIGIGGGVFVL